MFIIICLFSALRALPAAEKQLKKYSFDLSEVTDRAHRCSIFPLKSYSFVCVKYSQLFVSYSWISRPYPTWSCTWWHLSKKFPLAEEGCGICSKALGTANEYLPTRVRLWASVLVPPSADGSELKSHSCRRVFNWTNLTSMSFWFWKIQKKL